MKTAVEWYKKAIFEMLKHKENLSNEMFLQNMLNVHLRAKEMEKQQIKNVVISTFKAVDGYCFGMTAEEYYEEYFKPE